MKMWLSQKKTQAMMFGIILGFAARLGLKMSIDEVSVLMSPVLVYILGQGVADFGKSKAQIEAAK
jgi:hypothetical protein